MTATAGTVPGLRSGPAAALTLLPGVRLPGRGEGLRPDRLLAPGSLLLAGVLAGERRSWPEHLAWADPLPSLDLDALAAAAEDAGLRGYGGAGFPTATKLRAMRGLRPALVVVNASEGEQASAKDGVLLRHVPHLVLDGALLAGQAVGTHWVTVRVPHDRPDLPGVVRAAAAERGIEARVRVSVGPATFAGGEASAVVSALAGRPALPSPLGRPPRLPSRVRARGRSVLVSNVETFARLALAARRWPSASALLTVSGAVGRPGVLELPVSARVVDALSAAGGPSEALAGLVTGGWHGRWLAWSERVAHATLSRDGLHAVGGRWGAGVLVALPASVCPLALVAGVARTLAHGSAGQCGPCRAGLPFAAEELDQAATLAHPGPALVEASDALEALTGRGLCAHPTASADALRSALTWARSDIDLHRSGRCLAR
jgi:NADH:ubiquinone oxidoreductase subunit F (NADH-binding)